MGAPASAPDLLLALYPFLISWGAECPGQHIAPVSSQPAGAGYKTLGLGLEFQWGKVLFIYSDSTLFSSLLVTFPVFSDSCTS